MTNVHTPGFRDMHDRMDAHVKRENKRAEPRRTNNPRTTGGKFDKSQHRTVTKGVRVKRGEPVVYPYGGQPYRTGDAGGFASKQNWKRSIEDRRDQIGQEVVRDAARTRPGCARLTVTPHEATALAYKIRAAVNGGQLRDHLGKDAASPLYQARTTRVLETLDSATKTNQPVTLGVFTRAELKIIGSQLLKPKFITRDVRNLERKLAGNR